MERIKQAGTIKELQAYTTDNGYIAIPINPVVVRNRDYVTLDTRDMTVKTYRKYKGEYIPIKHRQVK